jgi:hypothetical protein
MAGTFFARYETALRIGAGPGVVAGRLQGTTQVTVADVTNPSDTRSATVDYELFGPGDVQRLAAGAISRRYPVPGASDAEDTKLALVEFTASDLPWRYSPEAATAGVLRPWLVLVVGHRAPDQITLRPDGRVGLGLVTQALHVLSQSGLWAHLHQVDAAEIARIVSPAGLSAEQDYVACVVPAFTADGADAWTGASPVVVDCYDWWSFRTGPDGDFPELAAKLHKADLSSLTKPFGRAQVSYRPPNSDDPVVLHTRGALRLPEDADEAALPPGIGSQVARLSERIVTPDGRGVVSAPRYHEPFTDPDVAAPPPESGWVDTLRSDPRARGAAGLGAWNTIEWQDRIADAAAAKAGDLLIAADRIRHVALGVEVSRSLWRRRVPDQSSAAERLAVLAPVLGRLPASGGDTVLNQATGHTPDFAAALLSSAARRALRPGPARSSLAAPDATRLAAVLHAANRCPVELDDPADIVPRGVDADDAITAAVGAAAGGDEELHRLVLDRLGRQPSVGLLTDAFRALAPDRDGRPDPRAVETFLDTDRSTETEVPLPDWPGWIDEVAGPPPCRPINLEGLSNAVAAAVDPTGERPPAVRRVLATLPGITHVGPVEIEPELDLPLWKFLSEKAPDWMLPGAGDLDEDSVVPLATNPGFVHALLTGANHQTTAELRWRNIPMACRWSPLRKFWQRTGGRFDIEPIRGWPLSAGLDSTVLGGPGPEAVVAFRTTLFRRYPNTVVYIYPAENDFTPPAEGAVLAPSQINPPVPGREDPTFTGTIGTDITFFGFAVEPAALAHYWVVLEEPPAGYRFYHGSHIPGSDPHLPPPPPLVADDNSAHFAYNRFATPVRVLIGPLL